MRDYYQMKAFEEINMKHKVEIIRNRLEIKMQGERQKGIKVSFAMLESLYKLYESSFRWKTDLDTDTMSTEIISDYDMHVIYSTADTLLLDDRLVSLFALFDSTVIRVPVKVLFLHLFIQFSKLQGNFDQAQGVLQQMKYTVKTLHHAFDFAIGEFLLASHIQWFGNADLANEFHSNAKETILKSKDTVDPPSIKHRIFNWIHQVLSTIAVNEPYNKYLDDIFAV